MTSPSNISMSQVHTAALSVNPTRRIINNEVSLFVFAAVFHILLGVLIFEIRSLSTIHAYLTIGLAALIAAVPRARIISSVYAISYLVGAELIWRMTGANIFYEIGKYAIIMVIGLVIFRTRNRRIPVLPLLYFCFMLPSTLLTIEHFNLNDAREQISFNLSGPLLLFMSAWLFSSVRVTPPEFRRLLSITIVPMLTIATYLLLNILNLEQVTWTFSSNFQASGGFGPNQISTILGLGVFLITAILLSFGISRVWWLVLTPIGLWFMTHGILTFSRGGVVAAAISFTFFAVHFARSQRRSLGLLIALVLLLILGAAIIPHLDELTGGHLSARYSESDLSNRDQIFVNEFELFLEQPVTGFGPGVANLLRLSIYEGVNISAHTEFTRMLVDHGILGVFSLIALGILYLQRYIAQPSAINRGVMGGIMLWSLLTMVHSAMRIAATPWAFSIGFIQIDTTPNTESVSRHGERDDLI